MLKQEQLSQLPTICQDFIKYLAAQKMSNNTLISYYHDLKAFVAHMDISSLEEFSNLTTKEIHAYINTMNGAKSTIGRKISSIKSLYNYLNENGLVSNNPATPLKQPHIQRKIPEYLNEEESIDLIDAVDTNTRNYYRDFAILTVLSNTGLRRFEICNIKLTDIKGNVLYVQGKGDKHRKVPLNEDCIDAIDGYMAVRSKISCDYLFLSERKQRISEITVGALVKKYMVIIGKDNLSTHRIRHSFASRLVKNNVNIVKIKDILGHGQLETTLLYCHADMEGLMEAVTTSRLKKK